MVIEEYEYKTINVTLEPVLDKFRKPTIETTANRWAELGWETVAVMPSRGMGYADAILIKRKKKQPIAIQVDYKDETLTFTWEDVRIIVRERE